MPTLPTNMEKARAAAEKNRADREHLAQKEAERQRASDCALMDMRRAFARDHSVPESEVTMIICRRGNRR